MSLESLPFEIVDTIFRYLDKKWHYHNLTVSKRWHSLVKRIVYREMKIPTHRFERLLQQSSSGQQSLLFIQGLSFTTKLTIVGKPFYDHQQLEASKYSDIEIMHFLSHFRSLKAFDFASTTYQNILLRILDTYGVEKLPHLEDILAGPISLPTTLSVYNKYRHRMKRIYFRIVMQRYDDYLTRQVLDMLPGFTNLTELFFFNDCQSIPFVSVLQSCPNLSTFECSTMLISLRNITSDQEESIKNNLKNLKSLKLNVPTIDASEINFFLDYFPENLELLSINMNNHTILGWVKCAKLDLIQKFLFRISTVKKVIIETREEERELRASLPPGTSSMLDLFYQILSMLQGNNTLTQCTAYFENYYFGGVTTKISVTNNSHLFYRYYLNFDDYGLGPEDFIHRSRYNDDYGSDFEPDDFHALEYFAEEEPPLTFSMCPVPTPRQSWICGPQIINDLSFRFENEDMKKFPHHYFDYAARNCPQLATFYLYYNKNKECSVFASQEKGVKSSLSDMAYVTYHQSAHSQNTINQLLKYFPKVKNLCYYARMNREAVYDLTRFQHLKTFTIDIEEKIKLFGSKNIFLDVEILGKNMACFEIVDQSKNGTLKYMLKSRTVGKQYDPNVRKYAFCIKCLPSLEKIKISKLAPLFNLAKYSSHRLKPSAIAGSSDIPIDLT